MIYQTCKTATLIDAGVTKFELAEAKADFKLFIE